MILRLHNDYLLRGWKGAACVLLQRHTKKVTILNSMKFRLLLLCDGVTDLDPEMFLEEEQKALDEFLEKNIVISCEEAFPLEEEQEYYKYPNRYVRDILWSVTGRCNFHCRHCYMDAPNGALGEISHEDAISLIDQMAECGIMNIALTGGETFVRKDIWDLITRISEHGIRISQIYTNGWLVNESVLDRMEELGQKPEFEFSLDGIGWHDWLRGVSGSEERVIQAIELCRKRGFSTAVESCFHKGSISCLRETVQRMGELDTRIKIGTISMTELWKQKNEGYAFNDREYYDEVLKYIPRFFEDGMPADLLIGGVVQFHKGSKEYRIIPEKHDGSEAVLNRNLCGAARMTGYITPEGRLLPCMPMTDWKGHRQFPKIQEIGLRNGLTDGFYMNFVNGKVRELFEKNEICNACEYKLYCAGGCRACALQDGDDLYGCDKGQCFFWKGGYLNKIRSTIEEAIKTYCTE